MGDKKRSGRVDWEDLRVLIELARQGSLSATARTLGVTHATVGRRIANLEDDLGQPLFHRDTGRYLLTKAGKRILEIASQMADAEQAILRTTSGFDERLTGPVRITCTEAVGMYIVLPALKTVRESYPGLDVYLNITLMNLSLARSDADIAVRLSKPAEGAGLVGVKVADLDYYLFAHRSYFDSRQRNAYDYIGYPDGYSDWPEVRTFNRLADPDRVILRTNNLANRIHAARLGLGVALLPGIMADAWPELIRISSGEPEMTREAYVLVHEDLQDVPRFKACVEVLAASIRDGRHGTG